MDKFTNFQIKNLQNFKVDSAKMDFLLLTKLIKDKNLFEHLHHNAQFSCSKFKEKTILCINPKNRASESDMRRGSIQPKPHYFHQNSLTAMLNIDN